MDERLRTFALAWIVAGWLLCLAEAKYRYASSDLEDPLSVLLQLQPSTGGPYGRDVENVLMRTTYYTEDIVNVVFLDRDADRWRVPDAVLPGPQNASHPNLEVSLSKGESFGFSIRRRADAEQRPIFEVSDDGGLVFEDRYLEITTSLPGDPVIYGLGERVAPLRLPYDDRTYTIFTKDLATPEFLNVYGAHPFYMEMRNGKAHGVLLLNSNGMDVVLKNESLTFKVMGGVLDFFFFNGPTPRDVVRQYLYVIGKTHFPPYWSLGWHQCRYGYKTVQETAEVVQKYADAGIPLEAMWNDIDYMDGYRDFTVDPVNFPEGEVRSLASRLHSHHQKYVLIFDPGIKVDYQYEAFLEGMRKDVFVKSAAESYLLGRVWPGDVYFVDFTHPRAAEYWGGELQKFHKKVGFDGIWIDMNEVSNFCDGECSKDPRGGADERSRWFKRIEWVSSALYSLCVRQLLGLLQMVLRTDWFKTHSPQSPLSRPPSAAPSFAPENGGEPMDAHTISLSAVQSLSTAYNVHNLYGHTEAAATYEAANRIYEKRTLIITRSSFVGTGRYAGHWLGDNHSTWKDLHYSISGSITMGLFGIPLVGADICGFIGNTTSELCARWIQLGAFYTFSRNHNEKEAVSQEPYAFGPALSKTAKNTIKLKYSLLPYYYTLFYESHTLGDPVLRGLFYEFPDDANTLENDRQLMVGPYLMVVPVLQEKAVSVDGYLPSGLWYDYFTGELYNCTCPQDRLRTFDAPLHKINLLLRGGGILPLQDPGMTTYESRGNPFRLLVSLDEGLRAEGKLYLDDGQSLDSLEREKYTLIHFSVAESTLHIVPQVLNYIPQPRSVLKEIKIHGSPDVSRVTIDSKELSKSSWEVVSGSRWRTLVISHPINLFSSATTTVQWS
ncbi:uncharacterized protein LOC126311211 [Schistocerca gregaria]|uniref:uncharacterized protein LOC126311211 n=1 Tax=Schistocerca gregaria TaxID=7010 RepID=UPI00211E81ED|nr:uncharacterized protein LOC126311211 [Schistocerca gregaria]